ncbi:MAG: SDR family NAD(P)-dependent oxidoreductase [Halanaerobiales bacterium]|nr:SDR family NAD(P)-dependent oxidoreductase [Halanaerobiales bacterium]
MSNIYKFILENINSGKIEKQTAAQLLTMMKSQKNSNEKEIAIIGISGNFPLSENIDELWNNVSNGIDFVRTFPESRKKDIDRYFASVSDSTEDIKYCEGAYLENIDQFDYGFFKISPKEASSMDPNQRLFLQTAFKAIEDAGYGGKKLSGTKTGVFVGFSSNLRDSYGKIICENSLLDATSIVGNLTPIIPSRLSFIFNLKGPSLVVDTACSSSLVAVALACQSIRSGQSDMAIASGVKINLIPSDKESEKIGMESSDGRTRTFDDNSDGTGIGDGIGAVLLKPLSKALKDGDNIYAVIKGVGLNQDGHCMGITAPNPAAQTEVLISAWEDAQVNPESISYIETHGTGTNLGDPIEIQGITNAFLKYTNKSQFCGIASFKTNIGHMYEAAGISNLIIAVMALKNKKIPASLHFNKPNSTINFINSPVYVNTVERDWVTNGEKRRCGVSSFGISGTNCHLVLEEAPENQNKSKDKDERNYIFTISAKSYESFTGLLEEYKTYLKKVEDINLRDLCYTAVTGRGHYNFRFAVIVKDIEELAIILDNIDIENIKCHDSIYYGYHKVVSRETDYFEPDCVNIEQIGSLTKEVSNLVEIIKMKETPELEVLKNLCGLYIKGAEVDWDQIFLDQQTKKISIPTYCFDQHRCWVELPEFPSSLSRINDTDLYYSMEWIKENQPNGTNIAFDGAVMVLKDDRGMGSSIVDQLRLEGRNVIEVSYGNVFEKSNEYSYEVGNDEESYHRLIESVKDNNISTIVHLFTVGNTIVNNVDELEESQSLGMYSLFYLTRALIKNGISENTNICLVSEYAVEVTGDETYIKPENVTMYGLGKVVSMEYPNLKCRCIDIDLEVSSENLLKEIKNCADMYQTAYRNGNRYVEKFTEVDINTFHSRNIEIKENNVYIITGGTGGIGLEIAKYFASKAKVNLVLINRSGMPDRSLWEEILVQGNNTKICHKIRVIKEIEASGSSVVCCKADVADTFEMKKVFNEIRDKFEKINGVVHAAGVPGDGYIIRKEKDVFDNVINPKLKGTLILDDLISNDELDFFVLFSSGVSIIGEVGQGDYVAANAFLDSYAAYRNKKGKPTLSIDWVSWKSAGMSVDYGFNKDLIFKAISTEQAIKGFDNVISRDIQRVVIGELNHNSEYLPMFGNYPFRLSQKIEKAVEESKNYNRSLKKLKVVESVSRSNDDVKLVGKDPTEFTEIEKKVASVYKEILGFNKINIHDSFFELGGDSVMLNRMHLKLEEQFPGKVKVTDLFAHTSVSKLAQFIGGFDQSETKVEVKSKKNDMEKNNDIAVIGMAVEMPLAKDIREYWKNLKNGVDHISSFPESRRKDINDYLCYVEGEEPEEIKYFNGGFLSQIDQFDYSFFKLTPIEAKYTDPYQRLLMKTVWSAIEDAGYAGGKLSGTNTGIYLGYASNFRDSYQRMIYEVSPDMLPISAVGNITAMMPSRISYFLNLKGPTMVIDTACSSTLVGMHTACKAIKNGDCDMAIVCGVRIILFPLDRENMKIGIESSTGKTMTFDNSADGSGLGEGSSAVLLKPLWKAIEDGDNIYATIKGSAVNQDGSSIGITAPNPDAQTDVIVKAWENAGISPEELSFIEAHGTGTLLGDPIELDGLQKAFNKYTDRKHFCAIGAVKSSLGHLFEGAGLASFTKAVLTLAHREFPPTLNFNKPNEKVEFTDLSVYVNDKSRKLDKNPGLLKGAVSAFGFSGTNCHIVLEEPPTIYREEIKHEIPQVFTLSANSEESLKQLILEYQKFFAEQSKLNKTDVCFTANTGRDIFNYRLALSIKPGEELKESLEKINIENLSQYQGPEIYYGNCQDIKKDEEIIDNEKMDLNKKVDQELNGLLKTNPDIKTLEKICRYYIKGADVNWSNLYDPAYVKRVSLPTYTFEKIRCWIDIPQGKKYGNIVEKPDHFYTMGWQIEKLDTSEKQVESGDLLVFKDKQGIGQKIIDAYKQKGKTVYQVEEGSCYEKLDSTRYIISGNENDYHKLIGELKEKNISKIVHLFTLSNEQDIDCIESLDNSQQMGLFSLFNLTRAMANNEMTENMDVVLVSSYVTEINSFEEKIIPENATLLGFGKVVRKEYPNLVCRCLDIDDDTPIESILEELEANVEWYNVAYRKGVRYVEEFREIDIETKKERDIQIHSDGVYVITGGTGGIGLEVAKYLSAEKKVNFALINRSKFPEKKKWDKILKESGDQRIIRKINDLISIEANGSCIEFFSADVSDFGAIKEVIDDLRKRFGRINGIVHAAGVGGIEAIESRKLKDFNNVFLPKVHGTWVLDKVTESDDLDFFILFSSVATMFSMAGQGDYIAANSYLDSYSAYRNRKGKYTVTINWCTWKETGMSVELNSNIDTMFKAIRTNDAINDMDQLLNRDLQRALIGEINYESKIIYLLNKFSVRLSAKIQKKLDQLNINIKQIKKNTTQNNSDEVILTGKEENDYAVTETVLAKICMESLGFNEINVYDNFFELGADSIILTRMHRFIDEKFPGVVDIADIFEHTSIYRLAEYIDSKQQGNEAQETENQKEKNAEDDIRDIFENLEKDDLNIEEAVNILKGI